MANIDKSYSSYTMERERKPGFQTPSSGAEAGRSQVRSPGQLSGTLCQNWKSKKTQSLEDTVGM